MTHAAQFALTHGAALLFTWILLQQSGVPIPSAPLLVAVGSLASNGRLRLVPSLVAAFTACLLADGFWYRVGRRGWSKSHRFCRTNKNWKDRVLSLIWRHSGATMLFAKFIVGSNMVSLVAGQAGLSAVRFLIYDSIGSLTWSGSYIALGYLLHGQMHWTLAQTMRPLLVVRAAIFLARLWRRRSLPHAAMLALATAFLCPARPVRQYGAETGMSARILHDSRRLPEGTIDGLKPFPLLTRPGFWRRFRA
jgi:membrane protein DedA with SNARE-associated domain